MNVLLGGAFIWRRKHYWEYAGITEIHLPLLFDRVSGLFHNDSIFCTLWVTNIQYPNTLQFEYNHQGGHRVTKLSTQIQVHIITIGCICVTRGKRAILSISKKEDVWFSCNQQWKLHVSVYVYVCWKEYIKR
jgi:hypothetical protein